ncbi:MAG: nucleotidyl transferase AbiEii/AbiGii toxin family protein [Patescibacteria group bacterium]
MAATILTSRQKQILAILAKDKIFSKHFYLSGGTALSEYYLHHRVSEDLDFFSENEIEKIWLNSLAKKIIKTIGFKKLDIEESFNRNLVYFSTPVTTIKTEFTYYPFVRIEPFVIKNGIRVDSLTDIAVNKFFTVYQKPTARHFIDLYLILTEKKYTWDQLEKLARIKFETDIDPIQLGSQLIKSDIVKDMPKMIKKLSNAQWRSYFIEQASRLKSKFAK